MILALADAWVFFVEVPNVFFQSWTLLCTVEELNFTNEKLGFVFVCHKT